MTTQTASPNPNGGAAAPAVVTSEPSFATNALWLCELSAEPVQPDACLACARTRQRAECDFTPPVLQALRAAMRRDSTLTAVYSLAEQAGCTVLRVSSLTSCTRQAWYRLNQHTPLEKPSRHWARLRGTIFHRALEAMAGRESIAEQRFVVSLQGLGVNAWVAGQVDHFDPETGMLTDLKTVNSNGRRLGRLDLPYEHHRAQLFLYAWLLEASGYSYPAAAQIVYMDMGAIRTVPVSLPSPEGRAQIEKRLLEKARAIVEAAEDGPEGDPRLAWQCRYCLFKTGCPDRDKLTAGNGSGAG